jgi:hypothetical protein
MKSPEREEENAAKEEGECQDKSHFPAECLKGTK